jgi:hypothetical protein
MEEKPLSRWRFELQSIGKRHWLVFYKEMLGEPVENIPRLYKALNMYGFWPLFEAIVETSNRDLNAGKQNYVIAVAKNKWKEKEQESETDEAYLSEIDEAKRHSQQRNEELARKLKKVKK